MHASFQFLKREPFKFERQNILWPNICKYLSRCIVYSVYRITRYIFLWGVGLFFASLLQKLLG